MAPARLQAAGAHPAADHEGGLARVRSAARGGRAAPRTDRDNIRSGIAGVSRGTRSSRSSRPTPARLARCVLLAECDGNDRVAPGQDEDASAFDRGTLARDSGGHPPSDWCMMREEASAA